jgi:hypothetical protein
MPKKIAPPHEFIRSYEVDNRPFLRLAHGTLLGLMHRRYQAKGGEAAMALAKQMLAGAPWTTSARAFCWVISPYSSATIKPP